MSIATNSPDSKSLGKSLKKTINYVLRNCETNRLLNERPTPEVEKLLMYNFHHNKSHVWLRLLKDGNFNLVITKYLDKGTIIFDEFTVTGAYLDVKRSWLSEIGFHELHSLVLVRSFEGENVLTTNIIKHIQGNMLLTNWCVCLNSVTLNQKPFSSRRYLPYNYYIAYFPNKTDMMYDCVGENGLMKSVHIPYTEEGLLFTDRL